MFLYSKTPIKYSLIQTGADEQSFWLLPRPWWQERSEMNLQKIQVIVNHEQAEEVTVTGKNYCLANVCRRPIR